MFSYKVVKVVVIFLVGSGLFVTVLKRERSSVVYLMKRNTPVLIIIFFKTNTTFLHILKPIETFLTLDKKRSHRILPKTGFRDKKW